MRILDLLTQILKNPSSGNNDGANESYVNQQVAAEASLRQSADVAETTARQNADTALGASITQSTADTLAASKAYTDQQTTAILRLAGDWYADTGSYPAIGTGTSGAIRRGDAYPVKSAGVIGGIAYDIGDLLYALQATPGQVAANWAIAEHNTAQATTLVNGTAKIALQSDVEAETTQNDTTIVTPKKWWQAAARLLAIDRLVTGIYTFVNGFKIGSAGVYATYARSAFANELTLKNNVYQSGAIGKSKTFNGVNQYGSFTLSPISNACTFSIWFKSSFLGTQTLFSVRGVSGVCPTVSFVNGYLYVMKNGAGWTIYPGAQVSGLPLLCDGKWHNLTLTWTNSAGQGRLYVDGNQHVDTFNWVMGDIATNTHYLCCYSPGNNYFKGSVDQTLVYSTVLNAVQIGGIYNAGVGTASPLLTSLVRRWEFDEAGTLSGDDTSGLNSPITYSNNPAVDNLGKVPTGGAASEATVFSSIDGVTNGERGQQTFGDAAGGNIQQGKAFRVKINGKYPAWVDNYGRVYIDPSFDGQVQGDGAVASAYLHLGAGKSTPGNAPLKFTPGVLLAQKEDGAMQYDGTNLYFTVGTNRINLTSPTVAASPNQYETVLTGTTAYSLLSNSNYFFVAKQDNANACTIQLTGSAAYEGAMCFIKNSSSYNMTVNMVDTTLDGSVNVIVGSGEKLTIVKTDTENWISY